MLRARFFAFFFLLFCFDFTFLWCMDTALSGLNASVLPSHACDETSSSCGVWRRLMSLATFPHCDEYDPVINTITSNFVCRELRRLASHCLAPFTHTSQVCVFLCFFVCVSLFSLFFVFVFLCVDQIYLAIYKRQQQDNTIRSQCPEFVMPWDCLVVEIIFTLWRSRQHWLLAVLTVGG